VLRSQAVEGSTVEIERVEGKDGEDPDVNITIKAPSKKRKKVAAGVGAEGDDAPDDAPAGSTELPEDPEVLPEAPDAPPAEDEPKPE